MHFDEIDAIRRYSPAWRLLRADNAPLVLSFLGRVFVEQNARSVSSTDLIGLLDDELHTLNEQHGEGTFPKAAKAYLEDWANADVGWLRKYYPADSDEPQFDATPAVEKALAWVESLESRTFIGTESRLNTVFELLRQMVFGAETDPDVRLAELNRRRDTLDREIAAAQAGKFDVLDSVAQRDRYQQFSATARELLADFREVEENFRGLDRELRERIAGWQGSKGELLADVLGSRANIGDSDQGRSFHAFYDFLLSASRQTEFTELLEQVHGLQSIDPIDPRMRTIHYDWLDAGERTQATVRLLSEQLRRFLDDQVWLENRRVMDILRSIESHALTVRNSPTAHLTTEMDDLAPTVVLPFERPLYARSARMAMDSTQLTAGSDDFDASALFDQTFVDRALLSQGVRQLLQLRPQVALTEVLASRPLEHGLAELVTYFALSDNAFDIVFDEDSLEEVDWTDSFGNPKSATIPGVTFVRAGSAEAAS